jgi:flagellar biosynthesis protein FlhA
VAARFTLDAMPGKQMSIDADLNAGIITDKEARQRRQKIQAEADFYGSMDGATKFVRGDAIASLIILVINVLGGFIIGIAQKGMGFQDALSTYTLLTVGDGLVTQIPALLISTASGIIVTRTGGIGTNFTSDLTKQLLSYPKALSIACGILILLALLGMPPVPVLGISALTGFAAYTLDRSSKQVKRQEVETARNRELDEMKKPESVMSMVQVDTLEIELGYNLISLVDAKRGGDLLDRVLMIRKQCALDLGFVVPPVRLRDNMQLERNAYAIKIRGSVVGKGKLMIDHYLAIGPDVKSRFQGVETVEPSFGLAALWVAGAIKDDVEAAGFTVVEPSAVIATHLTEIVKKHACEIINRQDVQNMLDNVKKTNGAVVNELTPLLGLGEIHRVLSHLLREDVSIRDLNTILETLADSARLTKDSAFLTEYVRQALGRQITAGLLEADQKLYVLTFEPGLEQSLKEGLPKNEQGGAHLNLDPLRAQQIIEHLRVGVERMSKGGHQPVVLCSPVLRFYFKRLSEKILPNLTVLSYNELQPEIQVESCGMIAM